MEVNPQRAQNLADQLNPAVVIRWQRYDRDLLLEENIDQRDAFCAVTDDDEINVMSSLMAKRQVRQADLNRQNCLR